MRAVDIRSNDTERMGHSARPRGRSERGPLISDPTAHVEPDAALKSLRARNGAAIADRRSEDERLTTEATQRTRTAMANLRHRSRKWTAHGDLTETTTRHSEYTRPTVTTAKRRRPTARRRERVLATGAQYLCAPSGTTHCSGGGPERRRDGEERRATYG